MSKAVSHEAVAANKTAITQLLADGPCTYDEVRTHCAIYAYPGEEHLMSALDELTAAEVIVRIEDQGGYTYRLVEEEVPA